MRRLLPLLALIAFGVSTPCAHADAAPAPPVLGATLEACNTSSLPVERVATFVGSMPAIARADGMRIRFDLDRRRPGERRWQRIQAPGFGTWERSAQNVAGFIFRKRVNGLWVPASYRARVRFEWIAADGSIVRRARARTPACTQPDLRPDLVPGALTADLAAQPGLAIYTLAVRNAGRSVSGAFGVRVGSGSAEVAPLDPGEQRAVTVIAPACGPVELIVARVDADGRVEEAGERGNTTRRLCPLLLG